MNISKLRSRRQFLSANTRHAYQGRRSKNVLWLSRHDNGRHFPVLGRKNLPKMNVPKYKMRPMTHLEKETMQLEKDLTEGGFKAYTIGIRLKSGETIEIPCILKGGAQGWTDAMKIAHERIMKIDPDQVDEIEIVDPSIGEVLHKIGHGAASVVRGIAKGVQKLPAVARKVYGGVKKVAMESAHAAGRAMAAPAEIREEYQRALEERPEVTPAVRPMTEDQAIAEAYRLQRIGARGAEPSMAIYRPAIPAVQTYAQRVASQEAVETRLEKELRGLHRQVAREHAREELERIAERQAKRKRHVKSGPYSSVNPLH